MCAVKLNLLEDWALGLKSLWTPLGPSLGHLPLTKILDLRDPIKISIFCLCV